MESPPPVAKPLESQLSPCITHGANYEHDLSIYWCSPRLPLILWSGVGWILLAYVLRNGGDVDDVRRHRLAVVAMGVVGLLIAWACETTYGWKRFW